MGKDYIRGVEHLASAVILCVATVHMLGSLAALTQGAERVDVITVKGIIDPLVAQYVGQGIKMARQDGAQCLVIQLDTPGGAEGPMRTIVQGVLNSPVSIVVYVSPPGARAASAGVFITLAADIAAMAPGTHIGAAHPVAITGVITGTMGEKMTSDAAAYAKAIAERRGRNATWTEKAVRESASITAEEAVDAQVVDLIADDLTDLLEKIDGWKVPTATGERILATRGLPLHRVPMSLPQRILHVIVDPNIAYLLFTVGVWALITEVSHPGTIFPGVTGAIFLILAFVAFGSLPVNWGGIALIVLAVILFILDIEVTGFALSVGGVIAFILGSLMIFSPLAPSSPAMPPLAVSRALIAVMTASLAVFLLMVLSAGIRAQRARVVTGREAMVGAIGVATSNLDPWGTVKVRGELWTAVAGGGDIIRKEERARVVAVEGLRLRVTRE